MRNPTDTIRIALGITLSLVLHATLVVPGFVAVLTDRADAPANAKQTQQSSQDDAKQTPPKDRTIELGIEQSDASTMTWIGYEEYREHLARLAEVEQAAFMTTPVGQPDAPASNSASAAQSPPSQQPLQQSTQHNEQTEDHAAQQTDVTLLPGFPIPSPVLTPPTESITVAKNPDGAAPPLADQPRESQQFEPSLNLAWRELLAALQQALRSQDGNESKQAESPPEQQQSRTDQTASSRRGQQREGAESDKESDATSTVDVPLKDLDPGKPLAAQGLELKPKRPEFTVFQRVTSSPGNPVGEITFDQKGVPINVKLVKSSYVTSVDQSIKDSLYGWRAAGKAIDALKPGETVSVRIRIILNPYVR